MQPNHSAIKSTYTLNYLKIYIWQILSIVLNLGALFIVLPNISENKELYGIYSVCIAFTIFLSYADLGFMNAGMKYAAEYFSKGNSLKEKQVIGFSAFILLLFILLFSIAMAVLAFKPALLFNNLSLTDSYVASYLLAILAISAPAVVWQRSLQMIYSIRLEDYVLQMVLIITNACKILSVFYFFSRTRYDIVGYFFCYQLLSIAGLTVAETIAKKKYDVSFFTLIRYFTFSREIYSEIKKLAFGSFFLTIAWVLFYELDPYVLARITDPSTVALYAVGLTLLSFYRSVFGALFNPFAARFNHLIGLNDKSSLKGLYSTVIVIMMPIVLFSIISLFITARIFIFSWLGMQFSEAILLVRFLILSNILAFISYPCAILLVAQHKIKLLYFTSSFLPVLYWLGVIVFYAKGGIATFAVSKLVTFLAIGIFYLKYTLSFLEINFFSFFKNYLLPVLPSLIFLVGILLYVTFNFNAPAKNFFNLLYIIAAVGFAMGLAFLIYYFFSTPFRSYTKMLLKRVNKPD